MIANETARKLACDSIVDVPCMTMPGRWVGDGDQADPWHRDGGCRFPGCGRETWVHGHHIRHWADGGPTDLDTLILLCGYHHRFLHEHGWRIRAHPDREPMFSRPDGREYPAQRPGVDPRLRQLVGLRT